MSRTNSFNPVTKKSNERGILVADVRHHVFLTSYENLALGTDMVVDHRPLVVSLGKVKCRFSDVAF